MKYTKCSLKLFMATVFVILALVTNLTSGYAQSNPISAEEFDKALVPAQRVERSKVSQTTGQVKVVLVRKDTAQPIAGVHLRLVRLIIIDDKITGLKFEGRDIKSDSSGLFLFEDVPPGKYILHDVSYIPARCITDDKGEYIRLEVKAGKIIDLGKISK